MYAHVKLLLVIFFPLLFLGKNILWLQLDILHNYTLISVAISEPKKNYTNKRKNNKT